MAGYAIEGGAAMKRKVLSALLALPFAQHLVPAGTVRRIPRSEAKPEAPGKRLLRRKHLQ